MQVMRLNGINSCQDKFQLFRDGKCAWSHTSSTWEVQVFLANVHTCLCGSEVNGLSGIEPPTVQERLHSANTDQHPHVP